MSALITIIISLLGGALPLIEAAGLSSAATALIDKIITTLEQVIPIAVNEVQTAIPAIQNIIATLKGTTAVTPAQFQALAAQEATLDAGFNAAAAAAGDPAPAAPTAPEVGTAPVTGATTTTPTTDS